MVEEWNDGSRYDTGRNSERGEGREELLVVCDLAGGRCGSVDGFWCLCVWFPLTPSLSLGEREEFGQSRVSARARDTAQRRANDLPLRKLRERVGVRGNGCCE